MEAFLSEERRLGRIHGRRKRMDVDGGQAAVGDQLTTGLGGSAFGLREEVEWWLGKHCSQMRHSAEAPHHRWTRI
ncbi:hypothetical protein VZT92_007683 [Zoarces viviparus]|uniref:Uncharacterized protein n=1 Tax=Zoarces viviparus TaxID=48416 RepID=A0AAW1FKW2_ZOAVI